MKCMADKKSLEVIGCSWNVENLKAVISQQSKIYIRPIQKNLSISDIHNQDENLCENKIQERCLQCGQEMNVIQLRAHLLTCIDGDDDDELPHFQQPARSQTPAERETDHRSGHFHEGQESEIDASIINPLPLQDHQSQSFSGLDNSDNMDLPDIENNSSNDKSIAEVVENVVRVCTNWSNPIEILKYLQSCLVVGKNLEVEDVSEAAEGETNHICVDRENILDTALEEIQHLKDLRITLKVDFYGESVSDLGGPRKEFFRLVLMAIKEKYFDHDLRSLLCEDYVTIGKIFGLSILQNGTLPTFIPHDVLNELFSDEKSSSRCIQNLRKGLDELGIYQIGSRVPAFIFLLRPNNKKLTVRALTHYLKPKFSETGSNSRVLEGAVYAAFMRYLREVASGRRNVALAHILEFMTAASEEPALGFSITPSINFVEMNASFIPTANTCSCCMYLPRPTTAVKLPEDELLFSLYDYAFRNNYFGIQ